MQTYTYVSKGKFELMEKPKPVLMHERDAIVKVTLASICSSDLHIKHGSVPRAVPGITVGHEMVGIVEEVGTAVKNVKPGVLRGGLVEQGDNQRVGTYRLARAGGAGDEQVGQLGNIAHYIAVADVPAHGKGNLGGVVPELTGVDDIVSML